MKKILLFFSLAIFVLPLAASAVAPSVTSPNSAGLSLNQRTSRTTISWNGDSGRYNVRLVTVCVGANCSSRSYSIAANVLIPDGQTSTSTPWIVGKITNGFAPAGQYKIRVCMSGQSGAGYCDESDNPFTILPPIFITSQEVYNLFKKGLDNRFSNLDLNFKTGIAGAKRCIFGNNTPNSVQITATMANEANLYLPANQQTRMILNFFKTEFLASCYPNVPALTQENKDGIKQAMVSRFKDLCVIERDTRIKDLNNAYNNAVKVAEAAKTETVANDSLVSITECNTIYNADIRGITTGTVTEKFIAKENAKLIKDRCVNDAYSRYYTSVGTALTTLGNGYNGAVATYATCRSDSDLGWD